jgi:glycosyltransferase involved in cell wall biosynthesis
MVDSSGGRSRVLLACNAPEDATAGVGGAVLAIGRQLQQRGWDAVYAFAPANPAWPRRVDRQLTYGRVVGAAMRAKPAVAIVSSGDGVLLSLVRLRLPLISHSHGLEQLRRRACAGVERDFRYGVGHRWIREPAVGLAARRSAALVVQNAEERDFAVDDLGVSAERLRLIPNGVEDAFLDVEPGAADRPTVLWIGSWIDRKGRADLPGILDELVTRVPSAVLHLLGTGAPASSVESWFPAALRPHVRVTPRTDRAGVRLACTEAWAGLSTSRFEGFALSVVEMMASRLPVVATPAGGVRALVEDGVNGVRVGFGDASGMARALAAVLVAPERRECLGDAARRSAKQFRWDVLGGSWSSLLEEVLDGAPGSGRAGRQR